MAARGSRATSPGRPGRSAWRSCAGPHQGNLRRKGGSGELAAAARPHSGDGGAEGRKGRVRGVREGRGEAHRTLESNGGGPEG